MSGNIVERGVVCELELANSFGNLVWLLVSSCSSRVVLLQPTTTTPHCHLHKPHKMASKNGLDYKKEYNNNNKGKGTRRAVRDVTEELVIELTKALPMRALFYHHLFFSALIGSLPVLHQYYELCDQTPLSTPPPAAACSPFLSALV